ncbi:VOC family protein [Chryseobacterium pennipullorum]|uniref:VOC family protein n=1 Tax=Chryseobacterium pennipullorum TaxID=2258963 RepID=A0A3D9B1W9_9FLAO|nr:VOC family protein [Chryseobacterium pennipullorum]REC47509.1 VOC family protein [Chryseobacterium pennipullorum]
MSLKILSVVWGVKNLNSAIAFWSEALNYKLKREPDQDFAILVPKKGQGIQLSLKLTTSEKPKRHHIDLLAENQKTEVERLIKLGASKLENWDYEKDADYVVLLDPDGNSFCVVQRFP